MTNSLYARSSRIAGTGCFAGKPFRKGAVVGEYTGERITEEEADERYAEMDGVTYLFDIEDGEYIDALHDKNPVKFINHSCSPNCESEQDGKRILIKALRKIEKGEELTYDYFLIVEEDDDDPYTCSCGTTDCRGTMKGQDTD